MAAFNRLALWELLAGEGEVDMALLVLGLVTGLVEVVEVQVMVVVVV